MPVPVHSFPCCSSHDLFRVQKLSCFSSDNQHLPPCKSHSLCSSLVLFGQFYFPKLASASTELLLTKARVTKHKQKKLFVCFFKCRVTEFDRVWGIIYNGLQQQALSPVEHQWEKPGSTSEAELSTTIMKRVFKLLQQLVRNFLFPHIGSLSYMLTSSLVLAGIWS